MPIRTCRGLAVACALLLAAPAHGAFAGVNGRISFSTAGDLWVVGADSSGLTRLTVTPEEEAQSAFSPDGLRIAYRRRPAATGSRMAARIATATVAATPASQIPGVGSPGAARDETPRR